MLLTGRNFENLRGSLEFLGERKSSIRAVSIGTSGGYEKASEKRSRKPSSPPIRFI
jgi:hypothetical protein